MLRQTRPAKGLTAKARGYSLVFVGSVHQGASTPLLAEMI
jgi:hypothetical protein